MTDAIQVFTTTDTRELAEIIARRLVERRLAACAQIGSRIESVYRWQGKIETSEEWLCTIKTHLAIFEKVEAAIRQLHTYDEPEIIALPIVAGSESYLDWITESVDLSG
jgi:periplasmic divalent cation tolerance protein